MITVCPLKSSLLFSSAPAYWFVIASRVSPGMMLSCISKKSKINSQNNSWDDFFSLSNQYNWWIFIIQENNLPWHFYIFLAKTSRQKIETDIEKGMWNSERKEWRNRKTLYEPLLVLDSIKHAWTSCTHKTLEFYISDVKTWGPQVFQSWTILMMTCPTRERQPLRVCLDNSLALIFHIVLIVPTGQWGFYAPTTLLFLSW